MGQPRFLILTDGQTDPNSAKTAVQLLRYRAGDVVAVLDRMSAGRTCAEVFGVGGSIPIVGSVDDAQGANTLIIGIAPDGGRIPAAWRPILLAAVHRGWDVIAGLHQFLSDDAELAAEAARSGSRLVDLRKNAEFDVAQRQNIRPDCLRIHTVGNDCCTGKMLVAFELAAALRKRGVDAKFVATGQTGMMLEGDGCAVDRVVADFLSGAAEKLVLANQHHDVMVVEGQGSLFHPRYSAVSLGLLHGVMPHGLILCYELGRTSVLGMPDVPLPPIERLRAFYEDAASILFPCRAVGVAFNSRNASDGEANAERRRVERLLGLPVCDVLRHGPDVLIDAILEMKKGITA